MSLSNVHIIDQNDLLAERLGFYLEEIVQELMKKKSLITIGLSGGSLIDTLASIVPRLQFPWARIRLFFVDERFVPFTSDDSTFAAYQQKLFRQLPLTEKNTIKIDPTLPSVEQAANDYQKKLEAILQEDNDHVMNVSLFLRMSFELQGLFSLVDLFLLVVRYCFTWNGSRWTYSKSFPQSFCSESRSRFSDLSRRFTKTSTRTHHFDIEYYQSSKT